MRLAPPLPVVAQLRSPAQANVLQAARPCSPEEAAHLGADEAHAVVHQLERRLARATRLLGADREQAVQLPLVGTERLEALADRRQELDDGLADGLLQLAVAGGVEAALEGVDRLARGDAHDLEQVRDTRLLRRVVADLALRV